MKQLYFKVITIPILFASLVHLPGKTLAQCTCSDGLPATAVPYSVTIPPTTSSILTFTFPQFDPSVGTLSCVRVRDTISGITTSGALNTGPDSTAFLFQLTLTNKITGPGIIINHTPINRTYGYDTLAPYGDPADTITYGPNPVFTNLTGTGATGGNAAYLGLGTVDFTYKINGGMIALDGGLNYKSGISTTIGGTIALTYYWCPAVLLSNSINGFSAVKNGSSISLKWTGENEQATDAYSIEYSKDGVHFTAIGKQAAYLSDGTVSNYQFTYNITSTDGDRLYFRIRKTNVNGNSGYSPVRVINLGVATAINNFMVYPNPSSKHISVEWSSAVSGNIGVSIVNSTGQQFYANTYKLNTASSLQFDMPSSASPGIYYLLVRDLANNSGQITKLVIR